MITQAVDDNNDWMFSIKRDNDAIKQDIKTKLLEWKGDCYSNQTQGIDWLNRFGKGAANLTALLTSEIKQLISNCEGVRKVELVDAIYDTEKNSLTIQYTCLLSESELLSDSINII